MHWLVGDLVVSEASIPASLSAAESGVVDGYGRVLEEVSSSRNERRLHCMVAILLAGIRLELGSRPPAMLVRIG